MKKSVVLMLCVIAIFLILPHTVKANWAGCHAMLNEAAPVNVGDTFIIDVGSEGITWQSDIYGLHYVIEYDKNVVEPILDNGVISYYNWETITSKVQEYDSSRVSYLIVDMKTNDKSKYVSDNNHQYMASFVKLAGIKFKIKETTEKSTIITLMETELADSHYYPTTPLMSYKLTHNNYTSQGGNPYVEESIESCVDKVRTFVNIYKKAYLTNIAIDNVTIKSFNSNTYTYNLESSKKEININATTIEGYTITGDVGKKTLNNGNNNFIIKVTSPTGDIKNYTLNVNYSNKTNKSNVNTLKTLTLSTGEIKFDSKITNYNVEVENDIDKIKIDSTLTDSKATYVKDFGNREVELKEGVNEVLIKVKAENESINTYTIVVTRKEKNDVIGVKKIVISNYSLNYSFEKTNYTLKIKPETSKLDILVELTNNDFSYDIDGNENLKDGSTITITVVDKNGNNKKYYINIVKENEEPNEVNMPNRVNGILIILSVCLLVIVIVLSVIIIKRKKA